MSDETSLRVCGLATRHPGLTVFENLDFSVRRGEFVCLIGHSGCGKSTILHALAGLDRPTEGQIFVNGREVTKPGLDRGVIFQNHNLLPWKTALQNVMFSVRARWPEWKLAQVRAHSLKYLELVGLGSALDRKPSQLSGGMRQRVGIARAFALEPELLLMDEPFGALDALTRSVVQDELLKLWSQTGRTAFMITHDVDEAIYLADRVLLMSNGPYAQLAESVEIDIPRPRRRERMIHDPHYYALRTRLLDFLIRHAAGGTPRATPEPTAAATPVLGTASL
jgi:nitrate/nitrite transport system ATP-binding protein